MFNVFQGTQTGYGGEQRLRIGVLRMRKDGLSSAGLHNFTVAHDSDAVGDLRHYAHVVRDEEHCHPDFFLKFRNQGKNLCLNRDVKRRCRFVCNQELRLAGKRHGDHDALTHAARELVREPQRDPFSIGNAHEFEQMNGFLERFLFIHAAVQDQTFGNLRTDREHRVQGGHRLLKDHGHFRAAQMLQFRLIGMTQVNHAAVAAAQFDGAVDDLAAAVFDKTHYREGGNGLAGSRFAYQRKGLAGADGEGFIDYCRGSARVRSELHAEVFNLQYGELCLRRDVCFFSFHHCSCKLVGSSGKNALRPC